MSTNRQVVLLLDVIEAVKGQVYMHNHRVSIYRPIIRSFIREGLEKRIIEMRCMGRDPAFDDALKVEPSTPIRLGPNHSMR